MLAQGPKKLFVEQHAFLPQRGLFVVDGFRHVDRAVDEAAAAHQLPPLRSAKKVSVQPLIRRACSFTRR